MWTPPFFPSRYSFLYVVPFISLFILKRSPQEPKSGILFSFHPNRSQVSVWIAIALILIGGLFRFWRLGSLFDGMAWDEAYKGLDAIAIREFGERPVYLNWNAGREALIAYLVAGSQHFFDYSIISVRAVLALAGTLTLAFCYLFFRKIFNQNVALLSTFLMAVSKWHIIHSRYGVRVALIVLFELSALYCVARAMNTSRRNSWWLILAGAITGLGFYTYIAFRIFPLVLIVLVLQKDVRAFLRNQWKGVLAGLIVFLVVLFPLARYFVENSSALTERISRTAVWSAVSTKDESPAHMVMRSTLGTLGLFTYQGDSIPRHNVAEEQMLSPFSTALFLLGVLLTLINFRKHYAWFLILYAVLTLVPGFLSVQAPQVSRTLGCVPPAMAFTAFGLIAAFQILQRVASPILAKILVITVLVGNLLTGPNDALLRYADILDSLPPRMSSLYGADRDQTNIARLINQLGSGYDVYLSPQFYFHATVEYLTYSKSKYKLFSLYGIPKNPAPGKVMLIILQPHETNMWWLRDDDGKSFFKWWRQGHGLDAKKVRATIQRNYGSANRLTRMSDERLMQIIQKSYPTARKVNLGWFTIFLIK